MRTLGELINTEEPGLALVQEWVSQATNRVELLPCDLAAGERNLLALQVTTRSPMGAIAYQTGGLLVDGGWLRILGAGCPRLLRSISDWNGMGSVGEVRMRDALLVGDDVVGGFFAINGGGIEAERGSVCYLSPDTLAWEDMGVGYSDWLHWCCVGDLARFYENARWPGWQNEIAALGGDLAFSVYPLLCAEGPPISERARRPVSIEELWRLHAIEMPEQLG